MVVPRNVKVSTVDAGLLDIVRGRIAEGCPVSLTQSLACSALSCFDCTRPPVVQPECRSVICRLQGFNSWVLGGAGLAVEGVEQLGKDTSLGSTSADCPCNRSHFPQPHLLFSACKEVGDPLADGGDTVSWESLEERISGMMVLNTELKSTNRNLAYVPGQSRWCRM